MRLAGARDCTALAALLDDPAHAREQVLAWLETPGTTLLVAQSEFGVLGVAVLLTRMRRIIEQRGERGAVTRARQAHAYRRRQRRPVLSFNDRHLVLRLRSRRGPEALSRNTEAAGKRRLRQVTTLRAAYFSSVKYQPFWSRFVVMDIV